MSYYIYVAGGSKRKPRPKDAAQGTLFAEESEKKAKDGRSGRAGDKVYLESGKKKGGKGERFVIKGAADLIFQIQGVPRKSRTVVAAKTAQKRLKRSLNSF